MESKTFSTKEVMMLTGCTFRQLVHWCMSGYIPGQVKGPGTGVYRRWTTEDLERVEAIRDGFREVDAIYERLGIHASHRR